MTVKVNAREIAGSIIKYKVHINNEKVAKIEPGEEKELTLPQEDSVLQIKQILGRSNKLVVNSGDSVEIRPLPILKWLFFIFFILSNLMIIIHPSGTPLYLIIFLSLFFLMIKFFDIFELTKKEYWLFFHYFIANKYTNKEM